VSRTPAYGLALGVAATIGFGVAIVVSPGGPELIAEIYLVVVAALALSVVLLGVANALPRAEPAPPQRPPPSKRLGQLESVAQTLDRAETSAFDLHDGLRPIAREIAAARLARRGVALDRQPARARSLLGERAWELVRPDREAPLDRSHRGYSRDELRAIVDALEAI
jgi:hypothetical protein